MISSISCRTPSGSAAGRSILLITGTISWSCSIDLVDIGQRLRLDALRRVDHQQRAFARGEAPRHFIGEVDVAGRVHQVELVGLAVRGLPLEPHGLRLDRDPALLLDLHIVEHLRVAAHLALGHPAGGEDQPVGKRRLAVVDMRDDAEISDSFRSLDNSEISVWRDAARLAEA